MSTSDSSLDPFDASMSSGEMTAGDLQYRNISQIQDLVREIRAQPGLENFMRGLSAPELMKAAESHPVVVLVADRTQDRCYAVILQESKVSPDVFSLEGVDISKLKRLHAGIGHTWRGATQLDGDFAAQERGMKISGTKSEQGHMQFFHDLWNWIVKPIIDRLGIKVCDCM
jgi:hypothetical protein